MLPLRVEIAKLWEIVFAKFKNLKNSNFNSGWSWLKAGNSFAGITVLFLLVRSSISSAIGSFGLGINIIKGKL